MSRRRSRYTVDVYPLWKGEKRVVVLAYSAEGAAAVLTKRGHHVSRVVKGDYRKRQQMASLTTERWHFNPSAIGDAFEAMTGAPLPSGLRFAKGRATRNQRGIFEASRHEGIEVRVARNTTAAEANRTLWHELAHVAQYVRMGGMDPWIAYLNVANRDGTGYRNRQHEREAREWEALADTDWLLDGERR